MIGAPLRYSRLFDLARLLDIQDLPLAFDYLKVDFTFPKSFPINTINVMRALRAIEDIAPEKLEKATDAFYVRYACLFVATKATS